MSHTCHAYQCNTEVKPEMIMCFKHWKMVPALIQRRIWATYRRGQCDDKQISEAYGKAAKEAIRAVAQKEGLVIPEDSPELLVYDMCAGQSLK